MNSNNLKTLVGPIVISCLLLTFSGLGISAQPKKEVSAEEEDLLEDMAKLYSVDKATLRELATEMKRDGFTLREVRRLVMLARSKTEDMIDERKVPRARDREAMRQNIKILYGKLKSGVSWREISEAPLATAKSEEEIKAAVYERVAKEFSISKEEIKNLEEKFFKEEDSPLRKTVMLIILARTRTDRLVRERKSPKGRDQQVMRDSLNYFKDQMKKGTGWGDLAAMVDLSGFEINQWANRIINQR